MVWPRCAKRSSNFRHDAALEIPAAAKKDDELLAVDEALSRLSAEDPVRAELVKLRYFTGLTIEDAAEVLNISPATAKRYWAFARTWLYREIARR